METKSWKEWWPYPGIYLKGGEASRGKKIHLVGDTVLAWLTSQEMTTIIMPTYLCKRVVTSNTPARAEGGANLPLSLGLDIQQPQLCIRDTSILHCAVEISPWDLFSTDLRFLPFVLINKAPDWDGGTLCSSPVVDYTLIACPGGGVSAIRHPGWSTIRACSYLMNFLSGVGIPGDDNLCSRTRRWV